MINLKFYIKQKSYFRYVKEKYLGKEERNEKVIIYNSKFKTRGVISK